MVATEANALNISNQGTVYYNGTATFSGVDGSTAGKVLTSNGTGVAPSFQVAPTGIVEYFSSYLSAPTGNVTGSGGTYVIVCDTTLTNTSNSYSTSTGYYTAPSNGQYFFSTTVSFYGGDALTTYYLLLWDGTSPGYSSRAFQLYPVAQGSAVAVILSANIFIPMVAAQQMKVSVIVGGTNANVEIYGASPTSVPSAVATTFSGFRVGT